MSFKQKKEMSHAEGEKLRSVWYQPYSGGAEFEARLNSYIVHRIAVEEVENRGHVPYHLITQQRRQIDREALWFDEVLEEKINEGD
jgi:hypothetical protein